METDPDTDQTGPDPDPQHCLLPCLLNYRVKTVQIVLLQMPEVVTVDDNDEDKLDFEADEPEN
jgi:hypothetical protein